MRKTGGGDAIVTKCSAFAEFDPRPEPSRFPVIRWHAKPPQSYDYAPLAIEFFYADKFTRKYVFLILPDSHLWVTVVEDGQLVYDSREAIPVDMQAYDARRALYGINQQVPSVGYYRGTHYRM